VPEHIIVKFFIGYIHILKTANSDAKLACGKFKSMYQWKLFTNGS
jgi:hypothetical protein